MKKIVFLFFAILIHAVASAQIIARYKVDFSRHAEKIAVVEGEFQGFPTCNLSMFVHGVAGVPEGEATYIQNLEVRNSQNKVISAQYLKEGEWKVKEKKQDKFTIRYEVRLEHDKYEWFEAGGVDEVSYGTPEGFFSTGYALFLFPAIDDLSQAKDVKVDFVLPKDWKASTPWQSLGNNSYQATPDLRFLLNNCLFVGAHMEEVIRLGDFELRMAIGKKYTAQKELFVKLMREVLSQAKETFGGAMQKQYLVVINEHRMTDGSAFRQSFSQIISGEVTPSSQVTWGRTMAHETVHLWNGHTIRPAGQEEWFKEGITDYTTNLIFAKLQIISSENLLKFYEKAFSRYAVSKMVQRLDVSLLSSGDNKQQQRFLVYGGGLLFGLALDVEIREATNNEKSLNDLLKMMFEEFGKTGKPYAHTDILRIANAVSGKDLTPFFEKYLKGKDYVDYLPYFRRAGLEAHNFAEELYLNPNPQATELQLKIRKGIFGF